jgi:hypothetical protein
VNAPRWFSEGIAHDPRPLENDPPDSSTDDTERPPTTSRRRPGPPATRRAGLTQRDLAVLTSLGAHRYLTTRQIERLHYRDTPSSSLAATRAAHRAVTRLHDGGLVDRLRRRIGGRRAGSAVFIWRLTLAGARVVHLDSGSWRSREPGMQHLAHTLDVAEVVVRLHERARTRPVDVTAVETEPGCWRRYATGANRQQWLKPDLRLTLRVPGHELHWFVEVDRGSEYSRALQHKIGVYLGAWRDGDEQARTGVFPRVAWIVPDQPRATTIDNLCRSTTGTPTGLFVVTARATAIDALTEPPR